jgi:pimeloyl-ACP methyl ester carboxylesterase
LLRREKRLKVECLENRLMLTASLTDGLLEIAGTDRPDNIGVEMVDSYVRVSVNGERSLFAGGDVQQINIVGYDGNDAIAIAADIVIRSTINGGEGNDRIFGGGGKDAIEGGEGDDEIIGVDGHDVLTGGTGNDVIYGGAGRDVIRGSAGDDVLVGGDGRDRIRGGRGNNEIDPAGPNVAEVYGSMYVEQALVHYILPEQSTQGIPMIMIPGRNLSSSIFVGTPDGREGWAQMFAEEGYDVYVINDPNFDFSRGFNVSPFTVPTEGAPPADPEAERAWQRDVWKRWGFGDSQGDPYPDTRFPTDHFDTFEANYPYVSDAGRSYSASVVALLEMTGPAMVMAHSAGASVAVNAATERPDLVTGFVMVEPAGIPDESDFPALAGMSMLGAYGDYIDSRNQSGRKEATEAAAALFGQYGGTGDVISLPEDHDVYGNTHLMMQDDNNALVADLIMAWLADLDTEL